VPREFGGDALADPSASARDDRDSAGKVHFAGTRRFNSSNQLSTTRTSPGLPKLSWVAADETLTIRPSGSTSYPRTSSERRPGIGARVISTGESKTIDGFVRTSAFTRGRPAPDT